MKIKRIALTTLAFILACTSVFIPKTQWRVFAEDGTDASNPIHADAEHLSTKSIENHKYVYVTETNNPFIVNGRSDYKIVIPNNASEDLTYAVSFFNSYLRNGTNVSLEIVNESDVNWSESKKYIVMESDSLFAQAGLTMPSFDLGDSGYYIKTVGNSVFVKTLQKHRSGSQHAVLFLLKHLVGYEMYSLDTVVYTKDGSTMPNFDVIEKPDFEHFNQGNAQWDAEQMYGMGADNGFFSPVQGKLWHNSFTYFPKSTYLNKDDPENYHPEWYADDGIQLCYSAHGDEDSYELMVETAFQVIKPYLDKAKTDRTLYITLTEQDWPTWCTCKTCTAYLDKYGTDSAVNIVFINSVADKMDAYLTELAASTGERKKNVQIALFAYYKTFGAPTKIVNGKHVPIDEKVICRDNVGVYIAPITASFDKSFYDAKNASYAKAIEGWAACTKNMYMWFYSTNFRYYLYPFNTYESTIETYRFCLDNNAKFMYDQAQWDQGAVTAFGKFKEYSNSKLMFNVNADYSKIVDDFFANYYREAAAPMKEYFNELKIWLKHLEETNPEHNFGGIGNDIATSKFWPKKMLDRWCGLIEEAKNAIKIHESSNPELYATLKQHIDLESVFPKYALIDLYSSYYSLNDLAAMKREFKLLCQEVNVTHIKEASSIDPTIKDW